MLRPATSFLRRNLLSVWTVVMLGLAAAEAVWQWQDDRYVRATAESVVARAGSVSPREKALAIRDYIRANVTFSGAAVSDRPFLRASAADTLQSGRGYCGEVSRAFVCLASAVGVPAQRVNLYGAKNHVVAEAELAPGGEALLIDCQNPPQLPDPVTLDEALRRPEYQDYSTLNLRRVGLGGLVPRLKLRIGTLTYWAENPHALTAALCGGLAALPWAARGAGALLRRLLAWRGWVHRSDPSALAAALARHAPPAAGTAPGRGVGDPRPRPSPR
jgi:hypothetical protein